MDRFARWLARTEVRKGVVLVPQRAVAELQGSFQVDVVDSDNRVSIRPVRVGEQMGKSWVIEDGLKSGERIIVEGLQKVRADTGVSPRPVTGPVNSKGEAVSH